MVETGLTWVRREIEEEEDGISESSPRVT